MLIDAFTFFNEEEMLLARVSYLNDVCDRFVISEASLTHQGQPKGYIARSVIAAKMPEVLHKLDFIYVDDMPRGHGNEANWERERYQRNALMRGLYRHEPETLVVISDIDELPNRDILSRFVREGIEPGTVYAMEMKMYMYSAKYQYYYNEKPVVWSQARISTLEGIASPQAIRKTTVHVSCHDAGWHLTYMGGGSRIRNKIKAFCHAEFNNTVYDQRLDGNVKALLDPYGRPGYRLVETDYSELPAEVVESHKDYFFPLLENEDHLKQIVF